jgi:hypothetical protein
VTSQTPARRVADALLATHIRYQGFQGNIRATTAPVSLDPQALNSLMALPGSPRGGEGSGVIVSDRRGRAVCNASTTTPSASSPTARWQERPAGGNDLLFVAVRSRQGATRPSNWPTSRTRSPGSATATRPIQPSASASTTLCGAFYN